MMEQRGSGKRLMYLVLLQLLGTYSYWCGSNYRRAHPLVTVLLDIRFVRWSFMPQIRVFAPRHALIWHHGKYGWTLHCHFL